MADRAAHSSNPLQFAAKAAPFVILVLAGMAARSTLAAKHPTAALLLFVWIAADTITLSLMARAPDHKPPLHAVIGALASASLTVWLTAPAALTRELLQMPPLAAVMVTLVSIHVAWASVRAARIFREAGASKDRWISVASQLFPPLLVQFAAAELSVIHMALFRWGGPADVPANSRAFTYHKHLTPMSATLLALSAIEVATYHLLVDHWSRRAAIAMFLLSDVGLIYLVGLIKSFRFRPVLITPDDIRIRAGFLIDQSIPFDAIASVATNFTGTDIRNPATFNAALIAWPNVLLRLNKPVHRHSILRWNSHTAVAFRLDDPQTFTRLLEWRIGTGASTSSA